MLARKLAALALFVPTLASADWGLGATVGNSEGTLFVPIQLSDTLRLEPFGEYSRSEFDAGGATATLTDLGVGLGVFRLRPINEHAQLSFGGRAAYLRDTVSGGGLLADSTDDGFQVEAVLGGEAFLLPEFSLGVEAYATALDIGGTTTYGTGSRVIARVFFK